MAARSRRARLADVHELALRMPHVTIWPGSRENPIYQVGGKSFVFFRNPRPDAVDPVTGERYPDVIVFWVPSESDKQALVQDPVAVLHRRDFDGHPSVLVRGAGSASSPCGNCRGGSRTPGCRGPSAPEPRPGSAPGPRRR
jgi:hypothetical protein